MMREIDEALTSDNLYNFALCLAARGNVSDEFVAKTVVELVREAIALKNVELHVALVHAQQPAPVRSPFGGGGQAH